MFKNLACVMQSEGMGIEDLANILGIHRNTLANKMSGESDFSLSEVEKIRAVFRKYDFDFLFMRLKDSA